MLLSEDADSLALSLSRAHPQIRSQLGECLKSIVYVDYPDHWPDLLQAIMQKMNTQVSK